MAQTQALDVIGVRFQKLGKMYHFSSGGQTDIEPGDYVVIPTRRGRKLGQVISFIQPEDVSGRNRFGRLSAAPTHVT